MRDLTILRRELPGDLTLYETRNGVVLGLRIGRRVGHQFFALLEDGKRMSRVLKWEGEGTDRPTPRDFEHYLIGYALDVWNRTVRIKQSPTRVSREDLRQCLAE